MKRYVVLSVNDNPRYLYHIPLVVYAWGKLGWWPVIFYAGKDTKVSDFVFNELEGFVTYLNVDAQFESSTISQVSRLYAACLYDGYLMTSDADMLPLSDYWQPDFEKITTWGRDLTDYHYPICFIGMNSANWRKVMNLDSERYNSLIARDLKKQDNIWVLDQDLITERLNESGLPITRIDRGTDKKTGYPIGRVDRSAWTLNHNQYIDAHLFHDVHKDESKLEKIMQLLYTVWPDENFHWFSEYHKEFKRLVK